MVVSSAQLTKPVVETAATFILQARDWMDTRLTCDGPLRLGANNMEDADTKYIQRYNPGEMRDLHNLDVAQRSCTGDIGRRCGDICHMPAKPYTSPTLISRLSAKREQRWRVQAPPHTATPTEATLP